jgi:hypothetical protein
MRVYDEGRNVIEARAAGLYAYCQKRHQGGLISHFHHRSNVFSNNNVKSASSGGKG